MTEKIETLERLLDEAYNIDNLPLIEHAAALLEELKSHEQEVTQ